MWTNIFQEHLLAHSVLKYLLKAQGPRPSYFNTTFQHSPCQTSLKLFTSVPWWLAVYSIELSTPRLRWPARWAIHFASLFELLDEPALRQESIPIVGDRGYLSPIVHDCMYCVTCCTWWACFSISHFTPSLNAQLATWMLHIPPPGGHASTGRMPHSSIDLLSKKLPWIRPHPQCPLPLDMGRILKGPVLGYFVSTELTNYSQLVCYWNHLH